MWHASHPTRLSYRDETLYTMTTRLWIPDRFMVRSPHDFSAELEKVGAYYWYRASKREMEWQTRSAVHVTGSYEAMQWLGGIREIPPGFHAARLRTRYDLLDILSIMELACNDEVGRWESTVLGGRGGADEHIDPILAAGARTAYEWALGLRSQSVVPPMTPEQTAEARTFFDSLRNKQASGGRSAAA